MDDMLLTELDAVLFDLDGTLLDTAHDLVRALNTVCKEADQRAPNHDDAARYVSHGAMGMVKFAFPKAGDAEHERHRARLVDIYAAGLTVDTTPYPGMPDVIYALESQGLRWGVVTNKMRYLAEPILQHFDFCKNCATLIGGDTADHNKPHPAPIQMALDNLGVTPSRALYVGDAEKDVLAGRAAGVRTVAVTWGYIVPETNPIEWGADYTIDSPRDLLELRP